MAEERTAHLNEQAHADFWGAYNRFESFRENGAVVRRAINLPYAAIARMIKSRIQNYAPQSRTISRYFNSKLSGGTTPQHFLPVSVLCTVLAARAKERDVSSVSKQAQIVQGLAEEVVRNFGTEFFEVAMVDIQPRTHSHSERSRRPWAKPSHLRRVVSALPEARRTDDPDLAEFPLNAPRFPATPHILIKDDTCTLIIKDESYNPTGSHKDRWALEKFLHYRKIVQRQIDEHERYGTAITLPPMSLISSGSAAFALQSLLSLYGLPPLRVVMDKQRADPSVVSRLRSIGALVRLHHLDQEFLDEQQVRKLTHNPDGLDITTREMDVPHRECFYDWLICEILQLKPTYIFTPFGTGDLYANLLTVLVQEIETMRRDRRLHGLNISDLKGIHVLGATTDQPDSIMDKLYAAHQPTRQQIEARVAQLKDDETVGCHSGIHVIEDQLVLEAMNGVDICAEPSGIAGLALFRKLKAGLPLTPNDRVVVVNTGLLR